jgi:spermidine synthase
MELWYTEQHTDNVRFSIKIQKQLLSMQSEFQQIDIFDSPEFGRFLTLDGLIMLTEKDEFIYHDMIVHVPMAVNPAIKNVLVIGAGDGGTVRELTRYPSVAHIDLVEIDKMVVDVCMEYLPNTAGCLTDSRVHLHFEDGLRFVRSRVSEYDLIIVDSTDPFGPGEGLFTKEFYGNCHKALREDGILVNQHESPYYDYYAKSMQSAHQKIRFAAFTRRISPRIRRGTGCSALRQKNIIRLRTCMHRNGTPSALRPNITTQTCTEAVLLCRIM